MKIYSSFDCQYNHLEIDLISWFSLEVCFLERDVVLLIHNEEFMLWRLRLWISLLDYHNNIMRWSTFSYIATQLLRAARLDLSTTMVYSRTGKSWFFRCIMQFKENHFVLNMLFYICAYQTTAGCNTININ